MRHGLIRLFVPLWSGLAALLVGCTLGARTVSSLAQGAPEAARPPTAGAPAGVTAFVDVNVVPMDSERVLPRQTVLVESGRVTALGPSDKIQVPAGATRIDGRDQYLIPGLADMHVHLHTFLYDVTGGLRVPHDTTLHDHWLFLFVANGVTTVRNMDYFPGGERALRLRARAEAGELLSPRIYTAGAWAGRDPALGKIPPESIATYLAAYKAAGYDFVKVRGERSPVFDSVVVIARRLGLPVAGHLGHATIEEGLKSGAYASMEHLDGYHPLKPPVGDLSKLPELAAATQRAGVWNMPHMTLFEARAGEVDPPTWPEIRYLTARRHAKQAEGMARMNGSQVSDTTDAVLRARRRIVKALQDAGAGLLLGSDTPLDPLVPGFATHHELAALVRAGLTPFQALAMATKNPAVFLKTLDSTGTIAVGKRADLVLLRGNPLQDIRHTAQPAGVMLGGRWFSREAIDRRLAVLPYWKFQGPDIEELAVLRNGLTFTNGQQHLVTQLREVHQGQWRALVDSLRSGHRGQEVFLDPSNNDRLLQLTARQLGEYRTIVLAPEQRRVFDRNARAWMNDYRRQGYRVVIPGVEP
jgi:imidazolonepropionase-like amidohydrolase